MALKRPSKADSTAEWLGASPAERADALEQLLLLADAVPQGFRLDGSPSLPAKVIAVNDALTIARIPHAIGGALALAYYGEPRMTIDVDINVFLPPERRPDVLQALGPLQLPVDLDERELAQHKDARVPWDNNSVHLFFSYDALHAEMPKAARRVPFARTTIPIVSPEHLVIRKALLDRPKDWPDIEAILAATDALDLDEVKTWLRHLAGHNDPRVTKLRDTARRLAT
jgi:hypothetical protein